MAVDLIDDTTGIFIDSGGDRTPFNVCIICYLGRLAMPAKNERTNYLNQAKEVSCGKFNIIFAKVQKTCGL